MADDPVRRRCREPAAGSDPGARAADRGRAELDLVNGIPPEYLQMNGTYEMTPEQRVAWEVEVRSLYDAMVRIVITPTWVKLIDFETTLPSAVEELVARRAARGGRA